MERFNNNYKIFEDEGSGDETAPEVQVRTSSLFEIMRRHFLIIFTLVILALVAALAYLYTATPIFTSTSKIYVEQAGPKIITELEGVMTRSKNYLYTQAGLLKSTPILSSALKNLDTEKMQTFHKIDVPIIDYLKKHLNIKVGEKDDIIGISFDSAQANEAVQVVNSVVDSYIACNSARKRSTDDEVLRILQKEKSRSDKEFTQKLKAMMDFEKNHEALAFENRNGNIILERLSLLSTAITKAELEALEVKTNYETIKSMVSDPVKLKQFVETERAKGINISGRGERYQLSSELNRLAIALADRVRQVNANHPSVKALQNKINHTKKQLAEIDKTFANSQLTVAEQRYLAAREREENIRNSFEEQRRQAIDLKKQVGQYALLKSDWEQAKKHNKILNERIKEVDVTEDVGALNISVLETAQPAYKPSKPQKARVVAIALVVGLILGFGIAFVLDWMDDRFRSSKEISTVLGVPVLGLVPRMSWKWRRGFSRRGQKVLLRPSSSAAEAYRNIRTAMLFGASNGKAKTMLATSPSPGDGKTTFVSNLAIAMAQAGEKTLIIDANLRKPMQHKIFKMDYKSEISGLLEGELTLDEVIHSTPIKNLDVLPARPEVANPSELLNSSAFAKVLKDLSIRYDRIVIDSPSVESLTDARILAALSDVTLLILRAGQSTRKVSLQACDRLLTVGGHLYGTVVTHASKNNGSLV
ncbi:MAG: GumC family protein [Planctomycetota bacterium]|jgi:capsular exopolysaccharide synthesis family protein